MTKLVIADKTQAPSLAHWFGTDQFGRDILSMIMVGARNSIAVALVAVGIGMGVGVPLGCLGRGARRPGRRGADALQRPGLRLPRAAVGDHDHRRSSGRARSTPSSPSASSTSRSSPASPAPARWRSGRANSSSPRAPPARAARRSPSSTSCPTSPRCCWCRARSSSRSASWPKPGLSYVGLGAQPPMPSWGRMLFDAQTRMIVAPGWRSFPAWRSSSPCSASTCSATASRHPRPETRGGSDEPAGDREPVADDRRHADPEGRRPVASRPAR